MECTRAASGNRLRWRCRALTFYTDERSCRACRLASPTDRPAPAREISTVAKDDSYLSRARSYSRIAFAAAISQIAAISLQSARMTRPTAREAGMLRSPVIPKGKRGVSSNRLHAVATAEKPSIPAAILRLTVGQLRDAWPGSAPTIPESYPLSVRHLSSSSPHTSSRLGSFGANRVRGIGAIAPATCLTNPEKTISVIRAPSTLEVPNRSPHD